MTPDRHQQALAATVALIAAFALLLARRRPTWRLFAHSLAALACIDVARLWTSPLAQARAQSWWGLDVALVALWPVVLGVGLLKSRFVRNVDQVRFAQQPVADVVDARPREPIGGRIAETKIPNRGGNEAENERRSHAPILPRLAALACFALALGAARPWLPRLAYLSALRLPRWALAALWVEALWRLKSEGPRPKPEPSFARRGDSNSLPSVTDRSEGPSAVVPREEHHAHSARLAQACALILAGCNAADLLAGAWLVPPWEAPAWGYARAVTWAAYGAVAIVMLAACRRRA